MALTRKWMPSPNKSSRGGSGVRLIVLHTTEGAQTIESLGSFFGNSSAQVSSHTGADNKSSSVIGEYVRRPDKAWTQGNANPYCISMELCTPSGAASNWSRDYWLNKQTTMLRAAAAWVAEEAKYYGIPLVGLSSSAAQSGSKGVCQHVNLGASGGGHHDCGSGFPMDQVIAWAKGGSPAPGPSPSGGFMSSSTAYDSQGRAHSACIWATDGKVNYLAPGGSWAGCDKSQTGARSGADISYNAKGDKLRITYVNGSGAVCAYEKPATGGSWAFVNLKGNAK